MAYNKTMWQNGDIINVNKLNNIENGIKELEAQIKEIMDYIYGSDGPINTSYSITRNLTNCTSSNTANTISKGQPYTTVINANSGYNLASVSVTMGGTNITSSAVTNGNTINISNVTGNIVITANAVAYPSGGGDTGSGIIAGMTYGKGINQTTAVITDNPECWATVNPITVERGATYKISMDATHAWVFSFDDNDRFRTHLVLGNNTNPQEYTFTADTSKIRYGCYDPNKQLTYCTLTKEGSSPNPGPEPSPGPGPGPGDTSYRITRNLTNCSSSNTANTITQGSTYSTTITTNTGHSMSNITVTMDGRNITSSVVTE